MNQLNVSNVREDIHALRHRLPFIPILTWPQVNKIIAVDNTGRIDFKIPEGGIIAIAKGIGVAQVYMSIGADSGSDAVLNGDLVDRGIPLALTLPEFGPFFVSNIDMLSFTTTTATLTLVGISVWTKLD